MRQSPLFPLPALLALALAAPAAAAAGSPPATVEDVPAAVPHPSATEEQASGHPSLTRRAVEEDAVALSLEQVIEMALQQNLDIVVSRYEAQKAANSIHSERGAF